MPEAGTLGVFVVAALALIVVPGPAVLYIVAQSIDGGRVAGIVSALGVALGGLVHVAAAAIGLSALLVSSATAFTVVKLAGAAYLTGPSAPVPRPSGCGSAVASSPCSGMSPGPSSSGSAPSRRPLAGTSVLAARA